MQAFMWLAFWLPIATLIYVYAGFSVLVVVVGRWRKRLVRRQPITPTVSLIVAAYNEERHIAERLDNALALDYPHEALQIIVASDGSDDATESMVAEYAERGVQLLRLPRRGKIHALNDAVRHATGDVLVFSDANSMYDAQALRKLARNFADPEVGGVAGNTIYTRLTKSDSSSQGEDLYWSYDKWLKQMESLTGSVVSAHGAIYGIRRELYRPIMDSAVTDDFAISTLAIEQGYRLVFESEALAYEPPLPAAEREFRRKVRLMTRGLRSVLLRRVLLNPFRYGFYSLVLFTHKVLRRLVPFMLLIILVSSLILSASHEIYLVAALAQVLFYMLAGFGYLLRHQRFGRFRLFYIPFFYCLANTAALIALMKVLRGDHIERWQPQRTTASV
jgi:cellulose synthase/poly-beta-1,6-N-acetylglucosamine synthase-like glycosyltransferase